MRKQMEEEIRAQLLANQQMLEDSETTVTWDQKVWGNKKMHDYLVKFTFIKGSFAQNLINAKIL